MLLLRVLPTLPLFSVLVQLSVFDSTFVFDSTLVDVDQICAELFVLLSLFVDVFVVFDEELLELLHHQLEELPQLLPHHEELPHHQLLEFCFLSVMSYLQFFDTNVIEFLLGHHSPLLESSIESTTYVFHSYDTLKVRLQLNWFSSKGKMLTLSDQYFPFLVIL